MEPDEIHIVIFTRASFRDQSLSVLLSALEEIPELKPTYWAIDERPASRNIYSRNTLLLSIQELDDFNNIHLYGGEQLGYTAFFSIDRKNLNELVIHFKSNLSQDYLSLILQFGSTLANALTVDYGYINLLWKNAPERYIQKGSFARRHLQKYGPCPPLARTWFGTYLIDLIGRECLNNCGAIIQDLPYGGIQADLVENLASTNHRTLTIRQRDVMQQLVAVEVFGDYSHPLIHRRSSNWYPILTEELAN